MKKDKTQDPSASVSIAERAVFHSLQHSLRVRDPQARRHARLVKDLGLDGDDLSDLFLPDIERGLGIVLSQDLVNRIHTIQDAINVCVHALDHRMDSEPNL